MKILPKLPFTSSSVADQPSSVKKSPLEKFAEKHDGYEEFVGLIQQENVPEKELVHYAKDVRKSIKKQVHRVDSFTKRMLRTVDLSLMGPMAIPIFIKLDEYDKWVDKRQTNLEKEKQYVSIGDYNFAVISPDDKKILFGEIEQVDKEKVPYISNELDVNGKSFSLDFPETNEKFLLEATPKEGGKGHELKVTKLNSSDEEKTSETK